MGFFSDVPYANNSDIKNMDALNEACMYSELAAMPMEERKKVFATESYQLLEAKGLIGKRTRVTLSKQDDLDRRETMAALQLAKEANDTLWDKLALNRVKERDLLSKIRTKYGSRAKRVAAIGQRDYIKTIRSGGTIKKSDIDNRA